MRALLSLGLVAAIGGCSNQVDSLVVVDITADGPLSGVSAFAVSATAKATNKTAAFRVSPAAGATTFDVDGSGQTFGIDLPKGVTGPLHVHVDALDATDTVTASGDGDTTIKAGARVDLPLTLMVIASVGADMSSGGGSDMGASTGVPMLAIDRATQTFGNVTVNQSSATVAITVTNHGDQPTSAITFTPSGADLDQFGLNSDCGAVLMPGLTCHVNATFKPTSTGDKHAHFVVAATMGGMVAADLSGTGTPPGTLTITADAPANGDCGAALVGATSATGATYTVKNVGTTATGTPTVSTSDSAQFVASGCATALQPNDTCTVSVQFTAMHRGQQTASVSVMATPGGTANASASGVGQNPATFSVTSTSGLDFGSAAVGTSGAMLTLTATNVGDVTSPALIATTLTGANPTSFTIVTDGCNTGMVMAGAACSVVVKLTPQALGAQTATLNVRSSNSTLGTAALTGMGTAPGTLSISADAPANGNCGSTLINTTSTTTATYTVKNIGTSATGTPMVTTSDTTQFAASGCAAALQPNATCTVTVTFTAKHHGTQTASVSVTATPGGTANASASGFGQNPASFTITSTSGFDFGSAATGTSGSTLTFTATNQGDVASPALIMSNLAGANPSSFSITSDLCNGAMVAAGTSCTVDVQFVPKAQGPLAATLNVRASTGTLGSASLSGTGTVPGTLTITANTPANGDCGSTIINTTSSTTATYTVKNVGTSATGMPTVSTSDMAQFTASGCAVTMLAPNATCTVSVSFTAKHRGLQTATVSASATPGGTANASVSGTGLNPATFTLASSTGSFDFGSVQRTAASSTITVTATNAGDVTSPTLTTAFAGNDGSFSATPDGCATKMIAAGASCTITTQLTPKTSGPQSATLQIMSGSTVLGSQTMTGTGTPIWVQEGAGISGVLYAIDGSDSANVFASGYTGDGSGTNVGLVMARNAATGAWTAQTLTTTTVTKQISVSSATNAWLSDQNNVWYLNSSGGWSADVRPNAPVSTAGNVSGVLTFNVGDIWATVTSPSAATIFHYTSASGWVTETTPAGANLLWGTSDSDLYAFGSYFASGSQYAVIVHRDNTGTWTRQYLGPGKATGGGVTSNVTSVVGVGVPATSLFATQSALGPLRADNTGAWTTIAGFPSGAASCSGVWAASTTAVWFACAGGIYRYDGSSFSTPFAPANTGFTWIWGSSANDVYAVGVDGNGDVIIYHLY